MLRSVPSPRASKSGNDDTGRGMREALSEREVEILRLVATGASNKEIGAQLDITESTVKVHLRNVFGKLEVRSRTEASLVAIEMGLVPSRAPADGALGVDSGRETEPAPGPEPVAWWRKLSLVLALAAVVGLVAWPAHPEARGAIPGPDPLREVGGAGSPGGGQEEVGRWTEVAQMPTARHRFAAAYLDAHIIVAGGDTAQGITGSVEIYDALTNTWRLGADKPTPVSNVAAAAVDGRVYVPGGLTADGDVIAAVEVYDPASGSWSNGPALPVPLCAYALATDGESLYLAGGWDGRQNRSAVYALDRGAESWRLLTALPRALLHPAAAWSQGRLYIVGGYDGRQVRDEVLAVPTDQDAPAEWANLPSLTEARAGLGVSAVGDALYVVGGGWTAPTAFCERLPWGAERWEPWEMPVVGAWRNMAVVSDDTTIYAIGGWNGQIGAELFRYQAVYRVMLPITG
ncbi:MAG: hypothetical protein GXX93_11145 [Anaerolineae bacterium]|nr:hypothetical protein [Anaerolineae bacterium]